MDRTIAVFSRSAAKAMRFVNVCIVLVAVCGAFAAGVLPSPGIRDFELFAFIGFVLAAIALAIGFVHVVRRRRPILEITTQGIRDRRVSPKLVPWGAISTVSVEAVGRRKMLVLDLETAAGQRLVRAGAPRANRRGLTISMTGLNGTFEDLVEALRRAEEATRHSW
jgi:hypothetical protein